MNALEFNEVLENRITKTRLMMGIKSAEYATGSDKFHNFKAAAMVDGQTPERALWGMAKKHLVSIIDIIDSCDRNAEINAARVDEKIGDMVNYLILLEGLLIERHKGANLENNYYPV